MGYLGYLKRSNKEGCGNDAHYLYIKITLSNSFDLLEIVYIGLQQISIGLRFNCLKG